MGSPTSRSGGVDAVDLVEDGPRRAAEHMRGSGGQGWARWAVDGLSGLIHVFIFIFLFFPIDLLRRALGPFFRGGRFARLGKVILPAAVKELCSSGFLSDSSLTTVQSQPQ
jgi:hypothetical protein